MNKSDLENDYLLNAKRMIWLAEDINEPLLERITTQLWYLHEQDARLPIQLLCRSDGGDSRVGLALANVIQSVGHVTGVMVGDTGSSAATVWASCTKRFVYPNVRMGIHPVTWQENYSKYDRAKLAQLQDEFQAIDVRQCNIYTKASNELFSWWWTKYNQHGDVKWLDSTELVAIGMAEMAEVVT